jgi:transketolase
VVRPGGRATVIAVGSTLDRVMSAVDGLDCGVLYCTTVSPFDGQTLRAAVSPGVASVVVVEPYGEGALVPDIVAALRPRPVRVEAIGVPRRVLRYGTIEEHDGDVGLTADAIRRRSRPSWRPETPGSLDVNWPGRPKPALD